MSEERKDMMEKMGFKFKVGDLVQLRTAAADLRGLQPPVMIMDRQAIQFGDGIAFRYAIHGVDSRNDEVRGELLEIELEPYQPATTPLAALDLAKKAFVANCDFVSAAAVRDLADKLMKQQKSVD